MTATMFGPYRLDGLLGRGGMGEVWRAYDTEQDRVVALKVLPADLGHDDEYRARFRREARIAARLNDPHVVPIHRHGEIDGRMFLDMRLVEGDDLAQVLRSGPLQPAEAVAVVEQIATALDTAHRENLVHRDVKPSIVLLADQKRPDAPRFAYLCDFGIARPLLDSPSGPLTRSGVTVGTLAYMAPERFLDRPIDARVDVYSLACLLYECLTGRKPFPGSELPALMHGHLSVPPPRPSEHADVPVALDEVVARGMAKDPADRHASAGELAAAARAAVDGAVHVRAPAAPGPTVAAVPSVAGPQATVVGGTWDDAAVIRWGLLVSITPGVLLAVLLGGAALLLVALTSVASELGIDPAVLVGSAALLGFGVCALGEVHGARRRGAALALSPPELQAGERAIARGFASLLGSITRFGGLNLTDRRLIYRDCRPGSRRAASFDLRVDEIRLSRSSGLRIDTVGPRRERIHLMVDDPAEWTAAIERVTDRYAEPS